MLAEIITIGDEILIGQIVDTNSAWMAVQLNQIGVEVKQITTVADRSADILMALTLAAGRADVIIMTGGLGPTKDDITKHTLATYFGQNLRRDAEVLKHVEGVFARSKRPMLDINKEQADVLEHADVLFNSLGTAPGMWISHRNKEYVVLPGVPFEMKHLMTERVLPRLLFFKSRKPLHHHTILTAGIGESFLAERLSNLEDSLPSNIHLAYLPKPGVVRLRLSATGLDQEVLEQKTAYYAGQIAEKAGVHFIGHGDVTLPEMVLEVLKQHDFRLAAAESCTGGYIAHLLTSIPGSSQVFAGSAVTYSNGAKTNVLGIPADTLTQYGAVSEETAIAMALKAKEVFNADYAIAVTGVAGPGSDDAGHPAGHIWIAVSGPKETKATWYNFGVERSVNIERASSMALYEVFAMIKRDN